MTVKEVKMYEATDGKLFKTKSGAENHSARILAEEIISNLGMSKEEITDKLKVVSKRNNLVKMLLSENEDWEKWPTHLIGKINKDLLKEPLKKTLYVHAYRDWGKEKEDVLFTDEGNEFSDDELHTADEWKVDKVEQVDEYTKKVFYVDKYEPDEKIKMKLEAGKELDESEISDMLGYFEEVYEDEGENRRWSQSMLTVVNVGEDNLYAIEWERGLTESQENEYYDQPYKVTLETKEVTITTTTVVPVK